MGASRIGIYYTYNSREKRKEFADDRIKNYYITKET
jgi:hypothetical protein